MPRLRLVRLGTDRGCGAVMGKAEGRKTDWHGHVTAVTVAPEFRRLGLAKRLMDELERVSEHMYAAWWSVDLFASSLTPVCAAMMATLWTYSCEYPTLSPSKCTRNSGTLSTAKSSTTTRARKMHTVRSFALPNPSRAGCILTLCYNWPDMRKALPRDVDRKSVVPLDHPVHPHELWPD